MRRVSARGPFKWKVQWIGMPIGWPYLCIIIVIRENIHKIKVPKWVWVEEGALINSKVLSIVSQDARLTAGREMMRGNDIQKSAGRLQRLDCGAPVHFVDVDSTAYILLRSSQYDKISALTEIAAHTHPQVLLSWIELFKWCHLVAGNDAAYYFLNSES